MLKLKTEQTKAFYAQRATDIPNLDDRMRRIVAECVRLAPSSVLDIGCGRGFLLNCLRDRIPGLARFGVELNPALAQAARESGIRVFEQNVEDGVGLEAESVDVVVMGEIIEHVFDPDAIIEEMRRILKPGGHLIVTTPNFASWLNRWLLLFGIQPVFSETSTRKKYGHWLPLLGRGKSTIQGHLKLFTLGALCELLADLGFTVERTSGYKFAMISATAAGNVIESIFRLRPSLASGFIVTALKADAAAHAR